MSVTEGLIKIGGVVLAVVGFCLLLSVVNIPLLGVSFKQGGVIGELLLGLGFLGLGIYVVRGGRPSI